MTSRAKLPHDISFQHRHHDFSWLKVKIGMAWPVNSNGPTDAEAFVVISTLQHYLRCNGATGGFLPSGDHAMVTIFPRRFGQWIFQWPHDENVSNVVMRVPTG